MRAVAARLRAPTRPQHRPGAHGAIRAHDSLRQRSWALSASNLRVLHAQTSNGTIGATLYLVISPYVGDTLSRKLAQGDSERLLVRGILRRVISLILLGMFVSAFPLVTFAADRGLFDPLWSTRFPGVLQRIGVCYGVAALLFVFASVRTQRMVLVACLLVYWPLITLVEVPGFGPPDIGTAMGTLQGYVDRAVFGSHIWVKGQYGPEGLLSTMPALATCLFGVEAGRLLQRHWPAATAS